MMRNILSAALVVAATLPALAETCPTNADLENGIRLTRDDPFFSVILTQTPDGLAEARVATRGAQSETVNTIYRHPLAVSSRISNGVTFTAEYGDDPTALNDLNALRTWSTPVSLFQNGEFFTNGTYTATLTGLGQAEIGPCTYDVWRVRDVILLDNGVSIQFEKSYAPELGAILRSIELDAENRPIRPVFFDEIVAE